MASYQRFRWSAVFLLVIIVAGGCQSSRKTYSLKGQVLSKDNAAGQVTVDNEEIPGFMPAMTMIYPVKDAPGFQQVQPGDRITAKVVVDHGSTYWLEHVAVTDQSGRSLFGSGAKKTREIRTDRKVPDVALVNQDGKTMHLGDFKGKAVLITFIYTRCPFPNFCPLMSSRFASIHNALAQTPDVYAKTHLVSISLDPKYDTPPVLRKYGSAYLKDGAAGFAQWDFVSCSPKDLKALGSAFGLQYFSQNNQITHSLSTALLAPDGTVKQIWPGSDWKTADMLAALKSAAASDN